MANIVYTLKQHPRTDEYHLFEGKVTQTSPSIKCSSKSKSMCKAMDRIDGNKFACKSEKEAFLECAKLGRQVCGNCMKELYGTED